jgi:hypothetical protein
MVAKTLAIAGSLGRLALFAAVVVVRWRSNYH